MGDVQKNLRFLFQNIQPKKTCKLGNFINDVSRTQRNRDGKWDISWAGSERQFVIDERAEGTMPDEYKGLGVT